MPIESTARTAAGAGLVALAEDLSEQVAVAAHGAYGHLAHIALDQASLH